MRAGLHATVFEVVSRVERTLVVWQGVRATLGAMKSPADALEEIGEHLSSLVFPGFVTATGHRRLPDLQRYLRAVERRLEKLPDDPYRDHERMLQLDRMWQAYEEAVAALPPSRRSRDEVLEIRWMLEELRVSYFAQTLGTPYPISDKRIQKALSQLVP